MGKVSGKRRHQASIQYNSKVRDGLGRVEHFDFDVPLNTKQLRSALDSRDPMAKDMLLQYVSSFGKREILAHGPWTCTVCSRAAATRVVARAQCLNPERTLVVEQLPLLVCRSSACEKEAHRRTQDMLREVYIEQIGGASDNTCGRILAVLICVFMLCCVIGAAVW